MKSLTSLAEHRSRLRRRSFCAARRDVEQQPVPRFHGRKGATSPSPGPCRRRVFHAGKLGRTACGSGSASRRAGWIRASWRLRTARAARHHPGQQGGRKRDRPFRGRTARSRRRTPPECSAASARATICSCRTRSAPYPTSCAKRRGRPRHRAEPRTMHRDVLAYPSNSWPVSSSMRSKARADGRKIARQDRGRHAAAVPERDDGLDAGRGWSVCAHGGTTVRVPAVSVKRWTRRPPRHIHWLFSRRLMNGATIQAALEIACKAAAICVTRPGAADSIPKRNEVTG